MPFLIVVLALSRPFLHIYLRCHSCENKKIKTEKSIHLTPFTNSPIFGRASLSEVVRLSMAVGPNWEAHSVLRTSTAWTANVFVSWLKIQPFSRFNPRTNWKWTIPFQAGRPFYSHRSKYRSRSPWSVKKIGWAFGQEQLWSVFIETCYYRRS